MRALFAIVALVCGVVLYGALRMPPPVRDDELVGAAVVGLALAGLGFLLLWLGPVLWQTQPFRLLRLWLNAKERDLQARAGPLPPPPAPQPASESRKPDWSPARPD